MAPLSAFLSSISPLKANNNALNPLKARSQLLPRTAPVNPNFTPGAGAFDPHKIDNRGIFALFALIGAVFVLAAIWFFFWAKNGGFHFREGDWEDYKSTVLRRKGPNGTTLSGATKTTRLGGGSVVANGTRDEEKGAWKKGAQPGRKEQKPRGNKNNDDNDVRAYRHEKPARVGGLNRESDGVFNHDFAYSDDVYSSNMSSVGGHVPINTPKAKKDTKWTKATKKTEPTTPSPQKKKNGFYANTPASNTSSDSHRPLRPNAHPPSTDSTPTRSRNSSPRKSGAARQSVPGSFYTDPLDFESRYSATNSDAGLTEDSRGTKAYFHPIPGLGSDGGRGGGGFRRGRGRRDSLSDSEGETMGS